ncbi:MAG: hypothetical protein SCH66_02110 [Methanolobus sp.]|nr:hypothetical protein [Methanolobus sp.]
MEYQISVVQHLIELNLQQVSYHKGHKCIQAPDSSYLTNNGTRTYWKKEG